MEFRSFSAGLWKRRGRLDFRRFNMLPTRPASVSYTSNPTTAKTGQHARPGGLVLAGRDNYAHQVMKDVSAGGGTVLIYLDPIITNSYGRYHDKLINASEFGPAIPAWPGPITANSSGNVLDFRSGSAMHTAVGAGTGYAWVDPSWTKLEAVMEMILRENPHAGGLFLDDVGSMSYFPGFNWDTFSDANKDAWRAGAHLVVATADRVSKRRGVPFMVNGTWGAAASTAAADVRAKGGGWPDVTKHGHAMAMGGMWERHARDAYGIAYCTSAQWASQSITLGNRFMFVIADNDTTDLNAWYAGNDVAFVTWQPTGGYDEVGTLGKPSTPTGLPSKVST